jgi:arsenate reductase (glutaredoxin)
MINYYAYPKCGTCRKAKKWLDDQGIAYKEIHIVENPPAKQEMKEIYQAGEFELKKFFNTSGLKYRELGLKDRLPDMSEEEQLEMLASDGMLIKRPLAWDGRKVTLGFKEADFERSWLG